MAGWEFCSNSQTFRNEFSKEGESGFKALNGVCVPKRAESTDIIIKTVKKFFNNQR